MAYQNQVVMWLALAVAALSILLMWRLSHGRGPHAVAAEQPGPAHEAAAPAGGEGMDRFLLRFVVDEAGSPRGETVAAEGDQIVLKRSHEFFLVPAASLRDEGGTLRVAADVNWEQARSAGEAWRARSHKEITYTEDEVPRDEP